MDLKDKIDSEEKWNSIRDCYAYTSVITVGGKNHAAPWWACRESARLRKGIYATTSVLDWLNGVFPVYAHVSKNDNTKVAYTPTPDDGKADRQITISLGRLMLRLCAIWDDTFIRGKVEAHLAECDPSYEVLPGSAAVEIYKTAYFGSCMHDKHLLSVYEGHHPAECYDSPDIGIAIVRHPVTKELEGRALVRTDSKVYIRTYGSPRMKRNLEADGWVSGTLVGTRLKKIPMRDPYTYLLPYIDANNGAGGSKASSVMLDGDWIRVVNGDLWSDLAGLNKVYNCGVNSHPQIGKATLLPVTENERTVHDQLLDIRHDRMEMAGLTLRKVVLSDPRQIPSGEDWPIYQTYLSADSLYEAGFRLRKGIYIRQEFLFEWCGDYYLDTLQERSSAGFYKLDPDFYQDDNWYRGYAVLSKEVNGVLYKLQTEDAVSVLRNNEFGYVHSSVDVTKSKDWVKVHAPGRDTPLYAEKATCDIRKTISGRTVVVGYHDVKELADGTVDFTRNTDWVHAGSLWTKRRVYYSRKVVGHKEKCLAIAIKAAKQTTEGFTEALKSWLQRHNIYANDTGYRFYSVDPTIQNCQRQINKILNRNSSYSPYMDEETREFAILLTEMLAEEAPTYLGPTPEERERQRLAAIAAYDEAQNLEIVA